MKNIFKFLILLVACTCSGFAAANNSKLIIGTWSSTYLEDLISYSEKTYFADGTWCGFFLDAPFEGAPGSLYFFRGKWQIENGILTSTVLETSSPYLTKGEEIKDKVVSINKTQLVLTSLETSETYKRYRVPENRGKRLCELPFVEQNK